MPMIISELLSYKADVICLQEVDAAIHNALLAPVLEANGYQGFYSNKVRVISMSLLCTYLSVSIHATSAKTLLLILLLLPRYHHSKRGVRCFGLLKHLN